MTVPKITPHRFVIFTDAHANTTGLLDICEQVVSLGGAYDFLIGLGDNASPSSLNEEYCSDDYYRIEGKREIIDTFFSKNKKCFFAVGNHDIDDCNGDNLTWIQNEYANANGSSDRDPLSSLVTPCNLGTVGSTQYYFIHNGLMFVVINPYWQGVSNDIISSSPATGGRIVDDTLTWLEGIFENYPDHNKLVFAHPNAFAFSARHTGVSSLYGDGASPGDKENRDKFWLLMDKHNCLAYFHGHTHIRRVDYVNSTSISNGENENDSWGYNDSKVAHISNGEVWTNYGYPSDGFKTFSNVIVGDSDVKVEQWSYKAGWVKEEVIILKYRSGFINTKTIYLNNSTITVPRSSQKAVVKNYMDVLTTPTTTTTTITTPITTEPPTTANLNVLSNYTGISIEGTYSGTTNYVVNNVVDGTNISLEAPESVYGGAGVGASGEFRFRRWVRSSNGMSYSFISLSRTLSFVASSHYRYVKAEYDWFSIDDDDYYYYYSSFAFNKIDEEESYILYSKHKEKMDKLNDEGKEEYLIELVMDGELSADEAIALAMEYDLS